LDQKFLFFFLFFLFFFINKEKNEQSCYQMPNLELVDQSKKAKQVAVPIRLVWPTLSTKVGVVELPPPPAVANQGGGCVPFFFFMCLVDSAFSLCGKMISAMMWR
jgi:hypothetical protein